MRHEVRTCDVVDGLRAMPAASAQCVVTSPPYWGLRDYGVAGQLGLEPDFEAYLARLVGVFREVRRVLRPDGTLWLNMGDCYVAGGRGGDTGRSGLAGSTEGQDESKRARAGQRLGNRSSFRRDRAPRQDAQHKAVAGLAPKNLVGQPWRVAFALQDDGWTLRMDNVWHKPNPMPESVRDRPTRAHEYVFLLARRSNYFYDPVAASEEASPNTHARGAGVNPKAKTPSGWDTGAGNHKELVGRYENMQRRAGWRTKQNASFSAAVSAVVARRNLRSVWRIPTQPFKGAHFATFPERLVLPCLRAGTSAGGACGMCGAPYRRTFAPAAAPPAAAPAGGKWAGAAGRQMGTRLSRNRAAARAAGGEHDNPFQAPEPLGWTRSCPCEIGAPAPCLVLDPFCGSGTVGVVAARLGLSFVGLELNAAYAEMARARIAGANSGGKI